MAVAVVDTGSSPPSLDELIEDMREDYLLCRDMGHPWRIVRVWRERGFYRRAMQCDRCRTRRNDTITASGYVMKRWYEYAENYLLPSAQHRADPDRYASRVDYRREAIRRLWERYSEGDS